ncbi:MAG: isoprenylcysteine carboxylmethyltransferase family protein [Bacteroidota bacterium]
MKKLIVTTVFCALVYFLPLVGKPTSYTHPSFLTVVFFFFLLFLTQPTFKAADISEKSSTDKFSMLFITVALIIILSGSVIDWAYFNSESPTTNEKAYQSVGLFLLVTGSTIRIWAISHLGKYFANTVSFNSEHQLVKSGPYKIIRHPSYLGAYLAIIGSAFFLNSTVFASIAIVMMFFVYQYRIKVEEQGLIGIFQNEYLQYMKQSKRMIPFIY